MGDAADRIVAHVTKIREIVRTKSTYSVVGWCMAFNLRSANVDGWHGVLHSPARQVAFLLGILLATPEPDPSDQLSKDEWKRVMELLNSACDEYQALFYPSPGDQPDLSPDWWRARGVAMPAFLHYAFNDLMASMEQVGTRIDRYIAPFDEELVGIWGVRASEARSISWWVAEQLQAKLDRFQEARYRVDAAKVDLLGRAKWEAWDLADLQAAAQEEYLTLGEDVMRALNDLGTVRYEDMSNAFPASAEDFWHQFTITRGSGESVTYPTERTAFDRRPLILVGPDVAVCPSANALMAAVLGRGEEELRDGPQKTSFLRHRDRTLEEDSAKLFGRWFGPDIQAKEHLFEVPDQTFEHDLIVVANGRCLIIEAKAAPPKEAFRDPERAFTRLKHAFRADTGIQHAFDQGNRLARRLRAGEVITLYDSRGEAAVTLDPVAYTGVYVICVTRDDHGPLATNLNLLLEKKAEDPFPWVVNVLDFEALCDAREYLGLPSNYLFHYLDERLPLNGKAWTTDELDLFAFRLKHGTLDWIANADADMFVVDPSYADIFDDIYRARTVGGEEVVLRPQPPVLTDLRASLEKGDLVTVPLVADQAKTPRNAPCPCGSGRKFKKCCGHLRTR